MKLDRIELRASQREREQLLEAAQFSGMTLSSFLRQAALEKSEDILKSRDSLTLSNRDRDLFLGALESLPKPNKRLQKAFKTYQQRKSSVRTSSAVKTRTKPVKTKVR